MILRNLAQIAATALALVAWAVAARHRPHRWFAAYATWFAGVDLVRLVAGDLWPPLERSLNLSLSFLFVALATHYFLGRSPRLVLAAFAAATVWVFARPAMPASTFRRLYFATYDAATALVWAMIVYGALFRRGVRPDLTHLAIALYAAIDAVAICFPMLHWKVDEWRVVMVSLLVGVVTSIVAHLVFLARTRREPASIAPS